jgi:transmembrane sensor
MSDRPDDSELDPELILRFVTGEASAAEVRYIRDRMAKDPEVWHLVNVARGIMPPFTPMEPPTPVEAAFRSQQARRKARHLRVHVPGMQEAPPPNPARRARPPRPVLLEQRSFPWVAVAAATVLAVGVGGAMWRSGMLTTPSASTKTQEPRVFSTQRGQRATLDLPDGTRLFLGYASTIRVPAAYGDSVRDVYLEGEAYFDVVHDTTRPFRVHAGNTVARDLGTKFNVRAYATDRHVEVAVSEGRVALADRAHAGPHAAARRAAAPSAGTSDTEAVPSVPGPSYVLVAGDVMSVDPEGNARIRRGVDMRQYLAWTHDRTFFDNTPLREVAAELSRRYNIDVTVSDTSIARLPITGNFSTEPADDIVNAVALSLDVQVKRTPNGFVFFPSPDSRHRSPPARH